MKNTIKPIASIILATLLTACGSSGGGSSEPVPVAPTPPTPVPPTTPEEDRIPDVFSFGQASHAYAGSTVMSGDVLVHSISDGTDISIVGGAYSIDQGEYQTEASTINAGQKVHVSVISSSESLGLASATLTVGEFSTDFVALTADLSGRVEAEQSTQANNLTVVDDETASGGELVQLKQQADVIDFTSPDSGELLSIRYRSDSALSLALTVSGNTVGEISLLDTNGLTQSAEFFTPIASNSIVSFSLTSDAEQAIAIDYIDVIENHNAATVATNMASGFNLGQMFESSQHEPSLRNAKPKIDAYYQAGFRNIRVPVTWTEEVNGSTLLLDRDTGEINLDHPRLAELIKVIEYSLSLEGMYVVVNMHHEYTLKAEEQFTVLETVWDGISDIFKDHSHKLLFEVLNEPHQGPNNEPMEAASVRRMSELAYNKIRAKNQNRIIIIGGNQWFGAQEMANTWPELSQVGNGSDQYLMSTFHHYAPWEFNGDPNKTFIWDESTITNEMAIMEQWSTHVGGSMPIYIGEWGNSWNQFLQTADCNNIRSWYDEFADQQATKRDIPTPTAVWDDGGWFMIWDHATNDWNNSMYQCIVGDCMAETFERMNEACTQTK